MSNPVDATSQNTEKKKQRSTGLLVLLIVFLILFLLTTIVLGSRLYQLATRDKYAVDLGIGTNGELELFQIEYIGDTDEITVQGANGQNVIAPGTTVDYDIRLRNRDEVDVLFVMTPKATFLTEDPVPLQVKLSDNYGNYLLGSDTEWVKVEELNNVVHKGKISAGEIFTYYLTWQWIFETGEAGDVFDTYLGNGEGLPGVEISILTESTAQPKQEKHAFNLMHLMGEGFGCCWCCYLVWLLLLVVVVLLFWIRKLNKKIQDQEELLGNYIHAAKN